MRAWIAWIATSLWAIPVFAGVQPKRTCCSATRSPGTTATHRRAWRRHARRRSAALRAKHDLFRGVDEVALDELHAELPEHGHRVRVFDALGDGLHFALAGRFHEPAHLVLQIGVARQVLDDRAVDLHEVEREARQQPLRVSA